MPNYLDGTGLLTLWGKIKTDMVTVATDQDITGTKTFKAPTNISGTEQATTIYETSNGGRIIFGKEGGNSGTMIGLDQVKGTRRLNFRASATPGAIVWSQPESGSCLYLDLQQVDFRHSGVTNPGTKLVRFSGTQSIILTNFKNAGCLYTDTNGNLKAGTVDSSVKSNSTNPVQSGAVYTALSSKADNSDIPTDNAELSNGAGYITSDALSPYAKTADLGTASSKDAGTASGNVPVLGTDGKLPQSVIPAVALTDTFVTNSESSMLALDAQIGDVCVRTDLNKSYILKASPASTASNWQELLTPTCDVTSVNGKTGAVQLTYSDVGAQVAGNYQAAGNYISYTNATADVAGTSKTVSKTNPQTLFVPNGLIMGGTAAAAGLTTRGICGVTMPDSSTGACAKHNLYLNYDGDNTYQDGRKVVLGAEETGNAITGGAFTYCAVRGDEMVSYVSSAIAGKANNTVTVQGSGALGGSGTLSGDITITHNEISRSDTSSNQSVLFGGSFDVVSSVTSDSYGHVTAINVKKVTIPAIDDQIGDQVTYSYSNGTLTITSK